MIAAAVAGSILQFSFADDDAIEDAQTVTATHSSPLDGNATATSPTPPQRSFVYQTCKEVREAGAYPLRRGEPGYGPHLDRNGNGLACEPA